MGDSTGEEAHRLIEDLAARTREFHFFRAVRLLEAAFKDRPRVGSSRRLQDDPVLFGQNPSLAFAPSSLDRLEPRADGRPPRLFVSFLGLLGPNGPLPAHVTEFTLDRQLNAKDQTFARFLDIFNNRILALFYRAWAVAQKTADYDRPEEARFAAYIGSLFGMGMESLRNGDAVPDRAKLYFSGRLSCQTRNAEGLQAIVHDFFGIPTVIEEFVGTWIDIPPENQCRLGESPATGSLGMTALAGSRKFESQMKFRIRMGPMKLMDLQRLLPSGAAFKRLRAWVLNYSGYELQWDLQCVLIAKEVPEISLGKAGQLGWTCWLKSKPFTADAEEAIFDPENYS